MNGLGGVSYYFSYHFRQTKGLYLAFFVCAIIGVLLGIVLHFTSSFGSMLLSDGDQLIFDFISKDVSVVKFIFSRLGNLFVAFLIIFVCSLSVYSGAVCFAFFVYQSMLLSGACCQIISIYGFLGAVNVVVLLLPVNLFLFAILSYFSCVCLSRTLMAKKYRMSLKSSFLYKQHYWKELCLAMAISVIFVVGISIVYSILLRSVGFILF